jgi:hypothetical protein
VARAYQGLTGYACYRDGGGASPLGNLSSFRGQGPLSHARLSMAAPWPPACVCFPRARGPSSIGHLFAISCSSLAARRNSYASLEGCTFFLQRPLISSTAWAMACWLLLPGRGTLACDTAPLSPETGATSSAKASCLLTDHSRCLLVAAQA